MQSPRTHSSLPPARVAVAALVCASLALASPVGFAAPASEFDAEAPPVESAEAVAEEPGDESSPEYEEANELFVAGVAHYDATEYEEAISNWIQASAKLGRDAEHRQIRAEMIYNIAKAQQKWFDIDHELRHLRQARRSLETFVEEIPNIYPNDEVAGESDRATEVLDGLSNQIEAEEQRLSSEQTAREERMRPKLDPVVDRRERRRNRAMIGTGAAFTVVGAAGLALGTLGIINGDDARRRIADLQTSDDLEARRAQMERGEQSNALATSGLVIGTIFALVGIPLLATGAAFEKRRRDYRASVLGSVGRGEGHVALSLQF